MKIFLSRFQKFFPWDSQMQSSVQAQGHFRRDVADSPLLASSLHFPQNFSWAGDTSASSQGPRKISQEKSRITDVVGCSVSVLLLVVFPSFIFCNVNSFVIRKNIFFNIALTASLPLDPLKSRMSIRKYVLCDHVCRKQFWNLDYNSI